MAQIILDSNNNLIQGDFDNATLNNRTKLQTTTTNATTNVYVAPNGSATSAGVSVANNSSLTNASKIVMATNGSTDTQIISGVNGSGTYLPLSFYTNNTLTAQLTTGGAWILPSNPSQMWFGDTSTGSFLQGTNTGGYLVFGTGGTERMRLSNGDLYIGATSSYAGTEKLSVTSTIAGWPASLNCTGSSTNGLLVRYSTSPNNNGAEFFSGNDSTTARCYFKSNGGLANYSANNTNLSDIREKKDIKLAGSYIDKICAIPVKNFLFNDQTDTEFNLGVIAQDVQAVAPELVMESNWAAPDQPEKVRLSIYQTDLQYALMKCIQEQQAIINELKTRIEALENK